MQLREAIQRAGEFLPEIFEDAAGKQLELEGVEKSDDGLYWRVTFSYEPTPTVALLRSLRKYKTIKLRDGDGEFVGAQDGRLLAQL
jgi:hypothetical protein